MRYPNLTEEKRLWRKGYRIVIGLDEAGRGPLSGPVIAAAIAILDTKYKIPDTRIRDSKQLSPAQRERFYKLLTNSRELGCGICVVSERIIDRINILEATKLAMAKAVKSLDGKLIKRVKNSKIHKLPKISDRVNLVTFGFLVLDGNFTLNINIPQKTIIKGDSKVFSCAAASILAKVTRDRIMMRYHKKYPRYRFDLHKGYGTRLHLRMLKKHGPCPIHRRTFSPVSNLAKRRLSC